MTQEQYQTEVLKEIGELKVAIVQLTGEISAVQERLDKNLEIAEGRMKGRIELIQLEINGYAKRTDEKIEENRTKIIAVEDHDNSCEVDCQVKRKAIFEKIDTNHDDIISVKTYQKIMWGIFGAVGLGVIALLIEMLSRVIGE